MRRVLALGLVTAGLLPLATSCGSSGPDSVARSFLSAWARGDYATAAVKTNNPTVAHRSLAAYATDLRLSALAIKLGHVSTHGATAQAEFDATAALRGVGTWPYVDHLQLQKVQGHWQVDWAGSQIYPQSAPGTRIVLQRSFATRAPLLDRTAAPLFTAQPVVNVGLEKARLGVHAATTIATVARVLKVDPTRLTAAVDAAKPNEFVPVITLRRAAYDQVKPRIYSLPGTVFTTDTQLLAPSTGFGRALLGGVGPVTADLLKSSSGAYVAGDVVGLSGLQAVFQPRLAGTPTTSVVVLDQAGRTVATLKTFPGHGGSPVRTTLDIRTQSAAEAALAHEAEPAALVAVDIHTGAILAAANTPDATSYDRAISGHYPPGSTFKLVTAYALLAAGVTPGTSVPCPAKINVGGKDFSNFEGESGRAPSFADDFAHSCNTAFISASRRLAAPALRQAATAFGVGTPWHLPVDAFSGSVPAPTDAVDAAAEAIGQGRVEVSPLVLALAAAAIADGTPHLPVLVTDPPQTASATLPPLDPRRLEALRSMMRRVVTTGTAAGAHLPAGTYGKTGTAEFGNDNPPKTHAWFVGYRGPVAFAVLVEGGGVGGEVAAPVAASFLRALPAAGG